MHTGAYPPTDRYAKPFYCLTFGLNMMFMQMYWKTLNKAMNMWQSHTNGGILYMTKDCQYICDGFILTMVCCGLCKLDIPKGRRCASSQRAKRNSNAKIQFMYQFIHQILCFSMKHQFCNPNTVRPLKCARIFTVPFFFLSFSLFLPKIPSEMVGKPLIRTPQYEYPNRA